MSMSKYNKTKKMKRSLLTIFCVVLLVGGILFGLESANVIDLHNNRTNQALDQTKSEQIEGVDYSPATSTDNDDINTKKANGTVDQEPVIPTNDTDIQITFIANAQDSYGGPLEIRTILEGVADGVCNLTLSYGSNSIKESSTILQQNNYFTCGAFSIPYNKLENGDWAIKLKITSGDGRVNEATTSTTIN